MTARAVLRSLRDMQRLLGGAVDQAKLACEFAPGSYTSTCLGACLAAEQAAAALESDLALLRGVTTEGEGA